MCWNGRFFKTSRCGRPATIWFQCSSANVVGTICHELIEWNRKIKILKLTCLLILYCNDSEWGEVELPRSKLAGERVLSAWVSSNF